MMRVTQWPEGTLEQAFVLRLARLLQYIVYVRRMAGRVREKSWLLCLDEHRRVLHADEPNFAIRPLVMLI